MKAYIKENHLSIIIIIISLISLFLMVRPDISNYLYKKEIEKQNRMNYIGALKYYEKFSLVVKNRALEDKFSDIEVREIYQELVGGCYINLTNDIKDLKTQVDTSCVVTANNILARIVSFNNENSRKEILQELQKLVDQVNFLMHAYG